MPLYDFHCSQCGHAFEALVRADTVPQCPRCANTALEKRVSAPVAPGRSKAMVAAARRQAAREGHMSHYSAAERGKLLQ